MKSGSPNDPGRFQARWNTSADAMVLTNAAGLVLAANAAYCDLHGVAQQDLVGHSLALIYPEDARPTAMAHYQTVFASCNDAGGYPAALRWRDGEGRLVESRIDFITRGDQESYMMSSVSVLEEEAGQTVPQVLIDEIRQWGVEILVDVDG